METRRDKAGRGCTVLPKEIFWKRPPLINYLQRRPVAVNRIKKTCLHFPPYRCHNHRELSKDQKSALKDPRFKLCDSVTLLSGQVFTLGYGRVRHKPVIFEDNLEEDDDSAQAKSDFGECKFDSTANLPECRVKLEDGELSSESESDGLGEEVTDENFYSSFIRRTSQENEEGTLLEPLKSSKDKKDNGCSADSLNDSCDDVSSVFSSFVAEVPKDSHVPVLLSSSSLYSDISDNDDDFMTTSTDSGVMDIDNFLSERKVYSSSCTPEDHKQNNSKRSSRRKRHHRDRDRPLPPNDLRFHLNLIRSQEQEQEDLRPSKRPQCRGHY